jgi:hypothetical protein
LGCGRDGVGADDDGVLVAGFEPFELRPRQVIPAGAKNLEHNPAAIDRMGKRHECGAQCSRHAGIRGDLGSRDALATTPTTRRA